MIIQEMNLQIEHRPGKSNVNADALSWNPVPQPKHNSPVTDLDSGSQESSEDCTAEEGAGEDKCLDSIAAQQQKDQQFKKW